MIFAIATAIAFFAVGLLAVYSLCGAAQRGDAYLETAPNEEEDD